MLFNTLWVGLQRLIAAFVALSAPNSVCAQLPSAGSVQSYPAKPVRIIVPLAPGANADLIGRIVAQRVSPMWGQPVLLDNRPGGSTNIGSEMAARAPADGYTLLLVAPPIAINVSLFNKLPFNAITDFAPIIQCTSVPNVMSVHPSVPARNLRELIALAKARPGQLNFGSGGQGSANHMAGELLKLTAGINIVHVPYKGSAPAITDGVGGHVEMIFVGISSILQLIEAGKLRPLAIGSIKRLPMIPQVPTFIEAGYPEMTTSVWFGLLAPVATPAEIVTRINADVVGVIAMPEVRKRLIDDGQEPGGGSAEDFGRFIRSEITKYAKVVKAAGIRGE
ncbi:MAG TPA: tripartite tricarboxylate transporter substrate binding protein [Burkholderiales bacterium]|nr:tripartite tricarboxylate transporter substrate binding protein [Burkholderiales bacterium]